MKVPSDPVRVLLVLSHPLYLDGIRAALTSSGEFKVVGETRYGEDVTELIETWAPALVLMDLSLPDISGIEVLRRLSSRAQLPRVLMMGEQERETQALSALQLGARGIVPEDIEPE